MKLQRTIFSSLSKHLKRQQILTENLYEALNYKVIYVYANTDIYVKISLTPSRKVGFTEQ